MGLDILTDRLRQIREQNPKAASIAGWPGSMAHMVCLDEFLKLLAKNPVALAQFKALLNNLIAITTEAISAVQLIVAQLETAINISNTFIQIYRSAVAEAKASLKLFPFGDAANSQCPPVQVIKTFVTSRLPSPDPSSLVVGNAKRLAKKYQQATQSVKELEYRNFRHQKAIADFNRHVEELKIQVLTWQAIIDAIAEQFGV